MGGEKNRKQSTHGGNARNRCKTFALKTRVRTRQVEGQKKGRRRHGTDAAPTALKGEDKKKTLLLEESWGGEERGVPEAIIVGPGYPGDVEVSNLPRGAKVNEKRTMCNPPHGIRAGGGGDQKKH